MVKKHLMKAKIEQVKDLAKDSILIYNDTPLLRLCVLGIPKLGLVIDTILTSKEQQISCDRLLDFINKLGAEIKGINEQLINLEFIESEEFYDLLVKSIEESLKTRHEEKRKYYARIIKNSSVVRKDELNSEFYLNIISELSMEELLVAKKLFELKTTGEYERLVKEQKDESGYIKKDEDVLALTDLPIDKNDYTFILLRLQKAGLIKEQTGMMVGYTGGVYDITETFRKLIKSIKE